MKLRCLSFVGILLLSMRANADAPLDGILDPVFGNAGIASASFNLANDYSDESNGIAISPSGQIYVAATVGVTTQGQTRSRFGLARFLAGGQLDQSFSGDGLSFPVPATLASQHLGAYGVLVRADGKPVVFGIRAPDPVNVFRIVACRYNVSGNLDATFDADGCAEPTLALIDDGNEFAQTGLGLADGRVLIGGFASVNPAEPLHVDALLLMLEANGSIAQGFGTSGYVLLRPPGSVRSSIIDLAQLPDGRFIAFGSSPQGMFAARLTSSGLLDTTFGVGGFAQITFADLHNLPLPLDRARAGAVDAQGRIYLCGHIQYNNLTDNTVMAFARLTPGGALDTSFSADGRVLRPFIDVLPSSTVAGCEVDGQNRLIAAVQTGVPLNGDFGALRLLPDGSEDLRFNAIGQTRVPINIGGGDVGHDSVAGLALMGENVIVAGTSHPINGNSSSGETLTMIRLSSDRPFGDGFEGN